jgi:hypothetical protein
LKQIHHKKGLVEWLKVQALSSRPSAAKKKKKKCSIALRDGLEDSKVPSRSAIFEHKNQPCLLHHCAREALIPRINGKLMIKGPYPARFLPWQIYHDQGNGFTPYSSSAPSHLLLRYF